MRVLVAGSNGFIGSALVEELRRLDHDVVRLVRGGTGGEGVVTWNPMRGTEATDMAALEGFDAVVNLGGISISEKRWTEKHKRQLWSSRVSSTRVLIDCLLNTVRRPAALINASAIGIYGNRGDEELTEHSSSGAGFLADLCVDWEGATEPASQDGIRVVNLRTGIVLGKDGGVLKQQAPMFRLMLGGRLGDGNQYMSWISLRDEIGAIVHALEHDTLTGPVNLVAPSPVRNAEYTDILGEVLARPTIVPAPRWMIAAALGGQLTDEVLLAGQKVVPQKLADSKFIFRDRELQPTLDNIFYPEPEPEEPEEKAPE